MNRYLLSFLLFCSELAIANSEAVYSTSETKALELALDVVEGEVLAETVFSPSIGNACFSYVYQLRVEKSYKGLISESEVISVGLNIKSFPVEPGQKQLILVMQMPENYYDFCRAGEAARYENMKVTLGYLVGLFEIFSDVNGVEKYSAVSCEDDMPILFEASAERMERVEAGCREVVGSYEVLKQKIISELE
ncbi:hypothetical protein [Microbulbifer yueqingensis]|uniref:DUF4468 domain-containing protein n=1 Tax=Microbulbifer yueqingensis TaxID=658219 RepID=A0A1G8X9B2_9GAMM|nr:hypothetical protein [Microbulbifer yueqingensis]SDJ87051.1 hypothetical protein SAMN05216212_1010 [Microbulbifer yueqingensis]